MNLQAQAASGLKWQAIEVAGRQLLSLAVFTTLARLLDPTAFGLIGLVVVYIAFVGMFVDQGISTALIQRKEVESRHLSAAFWFNVACATLLCLATIALAEPVARFFDEPRLAPLLRWASLALVLNATATVHTALFIRAMDFRRPMLRTLIANAAGGAVGVGMALSGYGVWALIGQQLTASFAGTCFLWAASSWRPSLAFSLAHLRQLLGVSLSVFATTLLWFFSSQLDRVVIGRFAGAAVLGQYVIGGKLCEMARLAVHQPVAAVSMPALSRLQDDYGRMCRAIYKGMEMNALVSFAVFVGLAAVAPSLVPLAFGEQWLPAISFLQLLAVYQLLVGLFVYCHPALLASGGIGRYVFVSIACTAGAGIACLVGIRLGVHALIIGLIGNIAGIGVLALFFLRQRMGLSPWQYCRPCLVPALAAAIMFAAVGLTRSSLDHRLSAWPNLIFQVIVGASAYVVVVLALAFHSLAALRDMAAHVVARRPEPA